MYFVQKPPTDSPSTTPSATKKPSAKLNSIFDSDEDDDLFRASNVGSKHNSVNFCYELCIAITYIATYLDLSCLYTALIKSIVANQSVT